jgi:hypothetical protein
MTPELLEISVEEIVLEIFETENVLLEYNQPPMLLVATLAPARAADLTTVAWDSVTGKPALALDPHTQPASSITDLEQAIETETDPGNLVLWFENQLV